MGIYTRTHTHTNIYMYIWVHVYKHNHKPLKSNEIIINKIIIILHSIVHSFNQ